MNLTHAINRQSFEYTCKSEAVAKRIRREIESTTAFLMTDIIARCLDEEISGDAALVINRLEIDLGNVLGENFGDEEMLAAFAERFIQEIRKALAATNTPGVMS